MSLQVESLAAGYGAHPVVRDVTFAVAPGEIVSVLGPSGSGKTTLLRVIAGLHPVLAGRIIWGDDDLAQRSPQTRRIGLVPQEGALFPHLSVARNIAYGLRGRQQPVTDPDARVQELLELIGLSGRRDAMPHELSGGQQQRVALARALAPQPRALLLDEPFSSLDTGLREQLRRDTSRILRQAQTPAVLITHDVTEAMAVSDRLVLLDEGRVVAQGDPRELYERPPNRGAASLLGPHHLLPASVAGAGVRTILGTHECHVAPPFGAIAALVRPEQLTWASQSGAAAAVVRQVEFHGHGQLIHVDIEGLGPLTVRADAQTNVAVGDRGSVGVRGNVHVLPA